jgi:hypothetical protein
MEPLSVFYKFEEDERGKEKLEEEEEGGRPSKFIHKPV